MMQRPQDRAPAANDLAPKGPSDVSPCPPLYDLVQIAARAMAVPLAVIVLNAASTSSAHALVATAADDPWVRDHATIDFACLADPRMAAAHGLGFYAAVPLRNADAIQVGTLAVLARNPRSISEQDLATLKRLARLAGALWPSSPVGYC